MKREVGKWEKQHVAGHSDDELWQTFEGAHHVHSWTQAHIGQLIVLGSDGDYVNKGVCPTCHGKTRVPCESCHGTAVCSVCAGTKLITLDQKKKWEAQQKAENAAKAALETLHSQEKKAQAKAQRAEVARNYLKLSEKYPDTVAGRKAKDDAERLAAAINAP